jgi:hypothetical protein
MTRRTALLLLFALATLPGSGCYCARSCFNTFRANHPCLFPCYNAAHGGAYGYGAQGYPAGCCEGCGATSFSTPGAPPTAGAVFGPVTPLPNQPTVNPGVPNPMK